MSAPTPAPTTPSLARLTTAELDALPVGAVVRFLDDPGRRHVVAFKGSRGCGHERPRWLLSDGGVFWSSRALADIGAVLHDPAPPVVDDRAQIQRYRDIRHDYAAAGPDDYVQRAAHFDAVMAPPVVDGGWTVADWEEWANEVAATLPENCDGDEAQTEIIAAFVRRVAAPPVVDETALAAALGDLWDDGNTKGLDGWIGLDRGEGDVDQYAVMAREKAVDATLTRLQRR